MDDPLLYEEDGLPTKAGGAPSPPKKNRLFDDKMRNQCWQKADVVPGRHPERWRKDVAGNVVCRRLTRCDGCLCYEYDHIRPFSKGGETAVSNCQILQARVNRLKSNRNDLASNDLKQFSCDLKFTGELCLDTSWYDISSESLIKGVRAYDLYCEMSVFFHVGDSETRYLWPEIRSCTEFEKRISELPTKLIVCMCEKHVQFYGKTSRLLPVVNWNLSYIAAVNKPEKKCIFADILEDLRDRNALR